MVVTDPSIVFEHLHATDSTAAANGMPTNGMNPALSSSRHQQPLFGSGSRLSTASEYSISEADERGDDVGLSMVSNEFKKQEMRRNGREY